MADPESKLRSYRFGRPQPTAEGKTLTVPAILDQAPFLPKTSLTAALHLPTVPRVHPVILDLAKQRIRRIAAEPGGLALFLQECREAVEVLPRLDPRTASAAVVILSHVLNAQCL